MAYRFNGSSNYVQFASSPFVGTVSALTIAAFFKRGSTADAYKIAFVNSALSQHLVGSSIESNGPYLRSGAGGNAANFNQSLSSTSLWYLLVLTWAGGAAAPRSHLHNGTSWSHINPLSGGAGNTTIGGTDRLYVGGPPAWGVSFNGDMVCAGIKKADSADLQVETLSRTAFSAWTAFGFDWLIGFDTSLQSAGVLQDQATPGTGDQIAISGTSVVSDPPGWSWGAAAPAFVPQITIVTR
jgi:hypothetical protein